MNTRREMYIVSVWVTENQLNTVCQAIQDVKSIPDGLKVIKQ